MSVYEKPRREKEDEEDVKWLDDLDIEEVQPKAKQKVEEKTEQKQEIKIEIKDTRVKEEQKVVTKTREMEFTEIIPNWVNRPWMYIQPTVAGQLTSWQDSWVNLILDYSRIFTEHVVNISDLLKRHPFTHSQSRKTLTQPVIKGLFDTMVEKGQAKWLDDNSILVRVYYKTDREWADEIMDFLVEKGYAAELMTLFELENLNQEWSSIPRSELRIILDLLVEEKRAKWVDTNKESLTFSI